MTPEEKYPEEVLAYKRIYAQSVLCSYLLGDVKTWADVVKIQFPDAEEEHKQWADIIENYRQNWRKAHNKYLSMCVFMYYLRIVPDFELLTYFDPENREHIKARKELADSYRKENSLSDWFESDWFDMNDETIERVLAVTGAQFAFKWLEEEGAE